MTIFFHYYYWKGASRGNWISLIGHLGKLLLKAFSSSLKHFKDDFLKVASNEKEHSFFLDKFSQEKYLLCWQSKTSDPIEVEYEGLSLEDQALADAFTFSPQLKSTKLVEFGENLKALSKYIGKLLLSFFSWFLLIMARVGLLVPG